MRLWELFGVQAWPTVILIDPEGNAVWGTSGEITFEQVDKVIRAAMPYYRQKKLLDETPLRFDMERHAAAATPLRFPGKILADEASGRLFISDSNHNRIVVAKLDGTLLDVIGSGVAGRSDGDFTTAQFNQPQGMALGGNELFVADTENHDIRRVDLAAGKVTTVAGTGQQGREPAAPGRRADPRRTALSSPWDLFLHGDDLFIAMAGCHQIWKMRLDGSSIGPYAGNGREDIVDGPLLPSAGLPAGLRVLRAAQRPGRRRHVALRGRQRRQFHPGRALGSSGGSPHGRRHVATAGRPAVHLRRRGRSGGAGPFPASAGRGLSRGTDLRGRHVQPQDPRRRSVGRDHARRAGRHGPTRDTPIEPAAFFEPAGLAVAAGKLFVADTNNHLIRVIDLKTLQVSTLAIAGLKPPQPPAAVVKPPAGNIEKLPPAVIRAEHGELRLRVELEFPPGYKINTLAPLEYRVEESPGSNRQALAGERPVAPGDSSRGFRQARPGREAGSRVRDPPAGQRPVGAGCRCEWRSIITIAAKGPRGFARSATLSGSCPWSCRPRREQRSFTCGIG